MVLRVPIGMTDVVILLGPRRARDKATRRLLAEAAPLPTGRGRRGFGERRRP